MWIKNYVLLVSTLWLGTQIALPQVSVNCSCLATQSVLITNACQAVIPDLCQFTNCFQSISSPPQPILCSQSPVAGTSVGPGAYAITISISTPGTPPQFCNVNFQVNPPSTGCAFSLNCASNKTVECGATWIFDQPTPVNPCPDASGAPGPVTLTFSTVTNGTCPTIITRTWQATDSCGTSATCQQTITVADTKPPSLKCPSDVTLECTVPPTTNKTGVATASDACSGVTNLTFSDAFGSTNCSGQGMILRTWTAIDGCGNISSCVQKINFQDTTPPTINCGQNELLQCGASWDFTVPIISDNCAPAPLLTLTILSTVTNPTCGQTFVATRVWSVTDPCGNSTTCTQVVTILDYTPPTITCGTNKTVACGTPWTFDNPSATDACDNGMVIVSVTSTVTNSLSPLVITRSWTAIDGCSNSSTCSQTVTVQGDGNCCCDFVNGDLEQPVPVNGTGGGWTTSGLLAGYSGWQPTGGNPNGCFLLNNVGDPNTDPTISQTLCCLKPGQCYTIRGQRKVQAWYGQTAPSFAVLVDGVTILALPVPTNPADTNWHNFSISFVATNNCQTIGFASEINGTDVSYWIDNIRLECCHGCVSVPYTGVEPVTVAGNAFVLVAANTNETPLFALGSDLSGNVYAGNNGNGGMAPAIPVQKYDPTQPLNPPTGFADLGATLIGDGDGMCTDGNNLFVPDGGGTWRFALPNTTPTLLPGIGINGVGSPLVCTPTRLYVGNGAFNTPLINAYNLPSGSPASPPSYSVVESVETMTPSPNPNLVFYADYSPRVRRFNFFTSIDGLLSTLPGADSIDGGLNYDGISQRVIVGGASGRLYLVHPTIPGAPILLATGFSSVVGVLREPLTGDLYVLDWHRLFRLCSNFVTLGVITATNETPHDCLSIVCPPNMAAEICGTNGMVAYLAPTVTNTCGAAVSVICSPPSPSLFPLGTTSVNCTATAGGNTATCSFTVTLLPDSTPPSINCACLQSQPGLTVNGCSGVIPDLCKFSSCYSDNCTTQPACSQSPAAGSTVLPGSHLITVTITDAAGNSSQCTVTFTVIAPTQTRVWNTGMGGVSGNVLLAPGTADPNYTLVSQPPGGCTGPAQVITPSSLPPQWMPDGPNSQWIGAGLGSSCQPGTYHFRICFDLACTDGAAVQGQWSADDFAVLLLNGQPTGFTVPSAQYPNNSFDHWHPITLTNGFVCGNNCLDFYVTNAYTVVNPTGFRAELTNLFNECCCKPAQLLFSVFSGEAAAGPLPAGAPDNHFAITCAPPGVNVTTPVVIDPNFVPYSWVPNGPNSTWIGPDQYAYYPAGVYCYSLNFNIPCPPGVPIRASLAGQWAADDTGTIQLNGQPTGITLPPGWAFTNWHAINITNGFVSGLNTLTFYVTNSGGPTGLRLELTGSASCCACVTTTNCSCTFINGDFSQPVPANGTGGGWSSSGLFAPGAGWQASGGNPGGTFLLNNVGDPNSDPTISQILCCFTPGQCYTIRGQRKVQAWYGDTTLSFGVLVDGVTILALPVPTNPADTNWYDFAVSFTATKACHTISFAAEIYGTDVSYWLDNLRVECCAQNSTSCIACPPPMTVTGCPPLVPDFTTNSFAGPGCAPIGPLTVTQSLPPGTPLQGGQTVIIVHVCDAAGTCRDCDVTIDAVPTTGNPLIACPRDRVLLTCSNSAVAYFTAFVFGNNGPVICTPPSGSAFPVNTSTIVTCTATNNCGGKASCSFAITVQPQRPRWSCYWMAVGIQATPLGQARLTTRPNLGSSGQDGVSIENLGSSGQDGVRLELGPAQKFTFTTLLDFMAPEGARLDIALPPDPVNPNPTPLLSFIRKSGPKGYCVKTSKIIDDDGAQYRGTAVATNGDLLGSLVQSANLDSYVPLNVFYQPGVTGVLMTVTLDCLTRDVTLSFPDCVWTADNARKGWDGCIYGNPKPPKKSASLRLTPLTSASFPPITAVDLVGTSLPDLTFDNPALMVGGRKWGDGHVTLMKAYDDGNERGLLFSSFGNGGGVHVDLGHAASFDLNLQKFETGDVPTQDDLLTRTIGPIRGLTNRPSPPPFLDALLFHGTLDSVECSADFSNVGSTTAHIQVFDHGVLVAERTGMAAVLGEPVLILPSWPLSIGKLGGSVSCRSGTIRSGTIRIPGGTSGGLALGAASADETVTGDEFRILAEPPPDTPHPDFYSGFEFEASDGPTWQATGIRRTLACPPAAVTILPGSAGLIMITWPGEGVTLQGAESIQGPWFDLGAASPVSLDPSHPARFFRLLCD